MSPTPDTSLRSRLYSFLRELSPDPCLELNEQSELLRSGLLDSAATLQLAEWIQREVGADVDLLRFDLSKEWNTVSDIERFILRHRHDHAG
jgi:aryl carrier-like protein